MPLLLLDDPPPITVDPLERSFSWKDKNRTVKMTDESTISES